jgi:DNA repair protein RadC
MLEESYIPSEIADTYGRPHLAAVPAHIPATHWQVPSAKALRAYVSSLGIETHEFRLAIFLNDTLSVLAAETLNQGTTLVGRLDMQRFVSYAVKSGATGVIIVHNRAGAGRHASVEDLRATRRVADVLEAADVTLIDHWIIASDNEWSARAAGHL